MQDQVLNTLREEWQSFKSDWRRSSRTRRIVALITVLLAAILGYCLLMLLWFGLNEGYPFLGIAFLAAFSIKCCSWWLIRDAHRLFEKERQNRG
jgi:hypothetical protein